MYGLIANFGDDSIALIQWAHQNQLRDVHVLSVDTGWQADAWQSRVLQARDWIQSLSFEHHHLKAEHDFKALVTARKQFPSQKFHWCAGFLKGLPILNWFEENDESLEATILLASRRKMSKACGDLPKAVEAAERYDERLIEYPLVNYDLKMRDALIAKTPFKKALNHRSLECHACIYLTKTEVATFTPEDIKRVEKLEKKIGSTMFGSNFSEHLSKISQQSKKHNYYDEFAKSCSFDYSCGL